MGLLNGPNLWFGVQTLNLILSTPLTVPTTVSPTLNADEEP